MEQINESLYRIELPLPFPLNKIYAYAAKGEKGWTIIDTGLHYKETERIWEEFLASQNLKWSDIEKIIITHYHPDHYGAAGWLQMKSNAPVYMSSIDFLGANLFWHQGDMGVIMQNFYIEHGMPTNIARQMIVHMNEFIPWVTPKPEVTYLIDGELINIGDEPYQAILTPGHSDGHLCFYHPEKRILFSGDHILPKITPNISLWPKDTDRNPLRSFLNSLDKIMKLDIDITYPAHKTIITDVKKRITELKTHHNERLSQIINWVGKKATGYEVCEKMFGKELSIHQLRFAMAETLAHLVYLESLGKLHSKQENSLIVWTQ